MATSLPTSLSPTIIGFNRGTATRINEMEMGDGYTQRTADGINAIRMTYSLEWLGSSTDIGVYITHFEERGGWQSFTWTPDDSSTEYKWTCQEWSMSPESDSMRRLNATLIQTFDLA